MPNKHFTYSIPETRKHKKTVLRVPESYRLHVCPAACARRYSIRAKNNKERDTAVLAITQADLISGAYEKQTIEAVHEIMTLLSNPPKAFELHFNCIDDFLGTDETSLLDMLRAEFPETHFCVFRMNPISFAGIKSGSKKQSQVFSFLEPSEKDNGLNILGNFVPLDPESEFYDVLNAWGIGPVRSLATCETFEEYMDMAKSRLNLCVMQMGKLTARELEKKLGTPYVVQHTNYRIESILENYRKLACAFGIELDEVAEQTLFAPHIKTVKEAIASTKELLGDTPILIDSYASMVPLTMARALHEYGFNVQAVLINVKDEFLTDTEYFEEHPEIEVIYRRGSNDIQRRQFGKDVICIGHDVAWLNKTNHFIDIFHDEYHFGFHGIYKLMHELQEFVLEEHKEKVE